MEKAAVLLVLELTQTAISGKPSLHPCLIFPSSQSMEDQRQQLFGDYDRLLQKVPGYEHEIMSKGVGVFEKPWVKEEEVPKGVLSEYLLSTIGRFREVVLDKAGAIYRDNVTRVDQALLSLAGRLASQGHSYFVRKKTEILGRFSSEQGDFLYFLKARDPLNAMRHSYRMAHLAFDRLRGHGERRATLEKSLIEPGNRESVLKVMDHFLVQNEQELRFWCGRFPGLRILYDVLLHMVDDYRVLLYQQKTGARNDLIPFMIDERSLKSLYAELMASYYNESCQHRTPSFFARNVEYVLNLFGSLYASEIGAKEPRPFEEVLTIATKKIQSDHDSITPYEENPSFSGSGNEKPFEYFEAIVNDHWSLAKQIALNGQRAMNTDLNWAEELVRLKTYRELLMSLFTAQDEFFKLKYQVALKLTDMTHIPLRKKFVELDIAEYSAQEAYAKLTLSFQKETLAKLNKQNRLWDQLKGTFTNQITRYLLTNAIFEQTPDFKTQRSEVQKQIEGYFDLMFEVRSLLGPTVSPMGLAPSSKEGATSAPLAPEPPRTTRQMEHSLLMLASEESIKLRALQAYSRFFNAEGFSLFVKDPQFEIVKSIEAAIAFCGQNISEKQPGWLWEAEKEDLEIYRRLVVRLNELSTDPSSGTVPIIKNPNLAPVPSSSPIQPARIAELRRMLLESYRKKVDTDYSAYLKSSTTSYTEALQTRFSLGYQSMWRKYQRWTLTNPAPDFRNPDFIRHAEMELSLLPMKSSPPNAGVSPLEEGWALVPSDGEKDKEGKIEGGSVAEKGTSSVVLPADPPVASPTASPKVSLRSSSALPVVASIGASPPGKLE